jgi:GNAT superfamily N-acetyltransferase
MSFSERTEGSDQLLAGAFTVVRKTSREFSPDDLTTLGLLELVSQGYGYPMDEDARTSAEEDFARADRDRFSLLALKDGKAVSAVSFGRWRMGHESKRGDAFWRLLGRQKPALARQALEFSDEAYVMIGIVTLPDYRKNGIAKRLLQQGIRDGTPSIVVGETKTPSAVVARASALAGLGYRTFYGAAEVTPGNECDTSELAEHLSLVYAKTFDNALEDFPVIYTTTDVLLPNVPDASTFPPHIQAAFAGVRSSQQKAGDTKTAVMPLISVAGGIISNLTT